MNLEAGDWIDICSIVVNIILGLWIAISLQNNITNRRILKDHFINEVKQLRDEYKFFFANVDTIDVSEFLPWFKLMSIKIDDLMFMINDKYGIEIDKLDPYKINLRDLITNNSDYIAQYRHGGRVVFSSSSKTSLLRFQQGHYSIFNIIIIYINDK